MNETYVDKWLKPMTHQSSYWNRCYQATVNGRSSSTFQQPQSSVLGNIFLEDTQVFNGQVVSDMMDFILSQATQAQAVSER